MLKKITTLLFAFAMVAGIVAPTKTLAREETDHEVVQKIYKDASDSLDSWKKDQEVELQNKKTAGDYIQKRQDELKKSEARLKLEKANLESDEADLKAEEAKLKAEEAKNPKNEEAIEKLKTSVEKMKEKIKQLKTSIENHEKSIERIKKDIVGVQGEIDEINKKINEIEGKIARASKVVNSINAAKEEAKKKGGAFVSLTSPSNRTFTFHIDANLVNKTGWEKINGRKYHFSPGGVMDTKWFEYKGSKYYLNTDGHAETGWDRIDGELYWFNSDGRMETGFRKIAGKVYNFGRDGVMLTYWQMLSNKKYYFNQDGHMETGWARIGDIIYLFSKEGVLQKNVTVGDWRVDEEGHHYNYHPVYYNQTDKAWSYKVFGQYGSFGLTGCCPTTIAMIVSGIKKRTISPLEVGTWAYEKTIYFNRTEAGGLPGLIPLAAQKYGVHHKEILTYPDLEKALKEGKLVYSSQNSKSPLNLSHSGTHAVALYGYQNGKTNAFSSSFYSTNGSYSLKKLWHYQGHFEKESGVSFFAFW